MDKQNMLHTRVDDEMLERLRARAGAERLGVSEIVRRAIQAYCGDPRRPGSINLAAFGDVQPREER